MRSSSIALAIATCLLVILALQPGRSVERYTPNGRAIGEIEIPSHPLMLSAHPLPPTLSRWQDTTNSGDYFSQVKATRVGYLVWSQFPVKVYVERSTAGSQTQKWVSAVIKAVQEWSVYLPLVVVEQPEIADITIWRSLPPIENLPRWESPPCACCRNSLSAVR